MIKILLIRKTALDGDDMQTLYRAFPGQDLELISSDPQDYKEHAANCRMHKPDLVILPKDRPIPSQAMEEGFVHVAITPHGLRELLPLKPEFKDYAPKT